MNNPLVSVIIPTYNSEKTLAKCMESIKNQTYQNIELVVVDNYSIDNTRKIARKYTDKILLQKSGMGIQINLGVFSSNGIYVLYIDDDMYLTKNVINNCINHMNNYDALIIPEECLENSFWSKCRNIEKKIYEGDLNIEAARFFKRSVFLSVGGINERLKGFRDFDVHQKIKSAGYKIGRISNSKIIHDVTPFLKEILIKRFLRAQTLCEYSKQHPKHYKSIIFRFTLIKALPKIISKKPLYGTGLYILKLLEYFFSGLGLIFSNIINIVLKHQARINSIR
ncbi:MAG: glycosyltransferase family 2 protein [Candidatus Hodarchaeota archaeon]